MVAFTPTMLEVIKNFTQITNTGIVFPAGNTIAVHDGGGVGVDSNAGRTIFAVGTLPNDNEDEFGVVDALEFYSALTMFDQPQVEVDNDKQKIIISSAKQNLGKFVLNKASPDVVKAPGAIKFPDAPDNITFRLTSQTYNRIFRGIGVVKSPEVILYGQNGELFVAAHDQKEKQANTYIIPVGDTDQEFSVIVGVDSLNKLMKSIDYNVTLTKHGIMRAASTNNELDICYYIAGKFQQ